MKVHSGVNGTNAMNLFWVIPAAAVSALGCAGFFYRLIKREDPGNKTMQKIASYVRQGAMAYLRQQYKVVALVFAILFLLF
ncbi:MAG: sodium/proton-translocating pyrophosphatase, partial [Puniceicoccales bacterium]|nr:sodium/proton-translocating pyrophosphatase [Puniceicoccales bacterium]